jgi:ABC-type proline/glycine betaine transport system permease subunit
VEAASFFPGGQIFCPPTLQSFSPLSHILRGFSAQTGRLRQQNASHAAAHLLLSLVALLIAVLVNVSIDRMSTEFFPETNGSE